MIFSQTILCNPTSVVPLLGGVEFAQSRRRIDVFTGRNYPPSARHQYEGGALADLGVRIDYSLDDGSNWDVLLPSAGPIAVGATLLSPWTILPMAAASQADVLVRAMAVGSALIAATVFYIELQYRA